MEANYFSTGDIIGIITPLNKRADLIIDLTFDNEIYLRVNQQMIKCSEVLKKQIATDKGYKSVRQMISSASNTFLYILLKIHGNYQSRT